MYILDISSHIPNIGLENDNGNGGIKKQLHYGVSYKWNKANLIRNIKFS